LKPTLHKQFYRFWWVVCNVAAAQANIFAILGNKIAKNLKIIVEIDESRELRALGS